MAVYLANTFDGGTNTATVTAGNSGGTSGPPWDSVTANVANGATFAYDTTHVLGGHPLAVKVATGVTATTCFAQWSTTLTGSSISQTWFRIYMYLTGNPAANFRVWQCLNGATTCAAVQILSTGKLRVLDTAGVAITTSAASIPTGQFFRVEGFVLASATVGQTEVRLYPTADAALQNYTEINTSAASQNTSTAITLSRFGVGTSVANVAAWWMASPGASDTGYLGPEAPVTGVPSAFPAQAWFPFFRPFPRRPFPRVLPTGSVQALTVTLPVTVTPAGALTQRAAQAYPVTATTTGALTRQATRTLPAAATATGAMTSQAARTLAQAVTTAGTVTRAAARTLAATVTPAGSTTTAAGRTLPATAATTGALIRASATSLPATATTASAATAAASRTLPATAVTTGNLARTPGASLPAVVTTAGTLARSAATLRTVTAATAGALTRALAATRSGAVTTAATVGLGQFRVFQATVTTAGALLRTARKILAAVASAVASVIIPEPVPGPRPAAAVTITAVAPGDVSITAAVPAAVTVTPAVAPAAITVTTAVQAVMTIAPAGPLAAVTSAAAPGQNLVSGWEPSPAVRVPPCPPAVISPQ